MPFVLGILAALGVFAAASTARARSNEVELVRAKVPFVGPVLIGAIAVLVARQRTIEGEDPPRAFKVQVVGVPHASSPDFTGLLLEPVAPMRGGDFLTFAADKISNVVPS